ncbi:anti-sigma factor domain-containing protein [Alicyclobacillus ferrooxydans]|uniref:RsgI N-terminal anti-sigma domain-containing protein n=1 Tax=Alicyclobacillus ferrooxydans TaxID=471514 RepID=A0A0P9GNY6_9BACL|nr:anti-sigma factor domain-containing protein [Alicyclobacillus ferrooxydans]KPV42271.1 hypothetical protein AN477_18345 [Alicyclobacillus ferrooxydans]
MKRRGLVLELNSRDAIVLTPDGDFCRIPRKSDMEVGLEVTWRDRLFGVVPIQTGRRRRRTAWRNSLGSVASGVAAVAVVAAGVWMYSGVLHPQTAEAYAWVSLDVKPSVALKVDKNLRVQAVDAIGSDAVSAINSLHLEGMTLSHAAESVLSYAGTHQDLSPQPGILVAVSPIAQQASGTRVESAATAAVKSAIQADKAILSLKPSVFSVVVPQDIWQAASQADIPPGRLMSVLVAAQEGRKTGLLDLVGSEMVQVWSDPMAQTAVSKIDSSNPADLAKVLQSLSNPVPGLQPSSGKGQQGATSTNNSTDAKSGSPHGSDVVKTNHAVSPSQNTSHSSSRPPSHHSPSTTVEVSGHGTLKKTGPPPGLAKGNGGHGNTKVSANNNSITIRIGNQTIVIPLETQNRSQDFSGTQGLKGTQEFNETKEFSGTQGFNQTKGFTGAKGFSQTRGFTGTQGFKHSQGDSHWWSQGN